MQCDKQTNDVPAALRALLASSVPGRVRLRGAALRSEKALARLQAAVQECAGVTECRTNARVGSVLLRYEPQRVPPAELFARLTEVLPPVPAAAAPRAAAPIAQRRARAQRRRRINLTTEYGMALTLGASLLAAATGAKGAHVLAGSVFTALLAQHLITYRRTLLRPLGISAGAR